MKMFIHIALLASLTSPLAWSAGTVQVYTPDSEKPKTLTNAGHLLDLVGQPRLAKSWWTGAVISERQATLVAEQKHQALLARLSGLAQQEDTDDAAAITSLRQQLQAVKVTGRQKVNLDPDEVRVAENGNPSLEGDYTLWLPAQPSTVTMMGLLSSPAKSRLRRAGTWRAISTSKVCSAERITAMPGWSIRTGIRRKRQWLTGINAISNLCQAASFLSVLPTISGRKRMTGLMPISFAP